MKRDPKSEYVGACTGMDTKMFKLEITEVGDGLGLLIPDEVMRGLDAQVGDDLVLVELDKGYRLAKRWVETNE